MSNSYDRMEWNFLQAVLHCMSSKEGFLFKEVETPSKYLGIPSLEDLSNKYLRWNYGEKEKKNWLKLK